MSSGSEPDSTAKKSDTLFFGATQAPAITVQDESTNERHFESESDIDEEEGHETDSSEGPAKIIPLKKISSGRPDPEDILPTQRKKRNNHKLRVPGGHAPTFKPISVDYDSEDALIVDMKQRGFKDDDVANRLIEEGYTQYDPKSIGSRWVRIRKKIQAYEEKLLDEELTDWHVGEDDLLREAVTQADEKVRQEIEKIQQRRFEWAAQNLNKRSSRPRFSARACRDRFEDLENGTARCPPELDSDPEGRRRERDQRLADFNRLKKAAVENAAADHAEKKKESSVKRQAAVQRREVGQQIREQKKREEEDYRRSRADASQTVRLQRQIADAAAREMRGYKEVKHRIFSTLHRKLRREADTKEKEKEKYGDLFPLAEDAFEGTGPPGKSKFAVKNTQEELLTIDFSATEAAINARAALFQGQAQGIRAEDVTPLVPPPKRPQLSSGANKDYGFFGEDPRAFCTVPELHDVLRSRKMLLNRMKENKGIMLSRLRAEDESLTHTELKDLLRKRGVPTHGPTEVLIRRLAEEDAKNSKKYKEKYLPQPLDEYGRKIKKPPAEKTPRSKFAKRYSAYEGVSKRSQARRKTAAKPLGKRRVKGKGKEKEDVSQHYAYDDDGDDKDNDDDDKDNDDDDDDIADDDEMFATKPSKGKNSESLKHASSNSHPYGLVEASQTVLAEDISDERMG